MRTLTKLMTGVAALAAIAVTASAAQAAVVFTAEYSYDGGPLTALAPIFVTPDQGWFMSFSVGDFSTVTMQGNLSTSPLFSSSSTEFTSTGPGTLDLFMIVQGLTAPVGAPEKFQTSISQNDIPAGWSIKEQAWLDPANGQAGGISLGALSFVGAGTLNPEGGVTNKLINTGSGPYSISTEYKLTSTSALNTSVQSNIQVYALGAVPEPATWGLMLVGFGGAGAMLRRRRAIPSVA